MRRLVAAALGAAALVLYAVLPVRAQPASVTTQTGPVAVERFAGGLVHPWGMAFLPDGRLLVTERPGRLRIVSPDGTLSEPLAGVPAGLRPGAGRPSRCRARPGIRPEPPGLPLLRRTGRGRRLDRARARASGRQSD